MIISSKYSAIPSKQLLGEILINRKKIKREELTEALGLQKRQRDYLGELLIQLGYANETDITLALGLQHHLPYINLSNFEFKKDAIYVIPKEVAQQMHIFPLAKVGNVLSVVMADPFDEAVKLRLKKITHCEIASFISTKTEIDRAIDNFYC